MFIQIKTYKKYEMRRENLDIDKYHSGGAGMAFNKD